MIKVAIFIVLNLAIIAFRFYKSKDLKETLIAGAILIYLFGVGALGFSIRVVPLFFIIFLVSFILAYLAFIAFLVRKKIYWYLLILPLLVVGGFFLIDFIDGSRYES